MERYIPLLFPTLRPLIQMNTALFFIALVLFVLACLVYIIYGFKKLKRISKHLDHSFNQYSYILIKLTSMVILGYICYFLIRIILDI